MNNMIKLGLTTATLLSTPVFAAEDLKSMGEPAAPAVTESMPSDATMAKPVDALVSSASMAVTKAQEATEAARIASDAAKVANDVAKMATEKAVEATDLAKKAMDSGAAAIAPTTDGGVGGMAPMSNDGMKSDTMKK